MVWAFTVACVSFFTIRPVGLVTARTTLRLWHDLYVEKKLAHDFQDVFTPAQMQSATFVAAVTNEEIKAIAQCEHKGAARLCMRRVAHAPHCESAGNVLIRYVAENSMEIDASAHYMQPRWFVAYNFYRNATDPDQSSAS